METSEMIGLAAFILTVVAGQTAYIRWYVTSKVDSLKHDIAEVKAVERDTNSLILSFEGRISYLEAKTNGKG